MVWCVVWDDRKAGEAFVQRSGAKLRSTTRKGYRATLENVDLEGKPAARYVLAPADWNGWSNLPRPQIAR